MVSREHNSQMRTGSSYKMYTANVCMNQVRQQFGSC
jgi:hypothetical protein